MGRYKRHSKTITKVVTPKRDIIQNKDIPKKDNSKPLERNPLTQELIRGFLVSVKKSNNYNSLYCYYKPFTEVLNKCHYFLESKCNTKRTALQIGNKIAMHGRPRHLWYDKTLYNSLFGKLCLLNELLEYRGRLDVPFLRHCELRSDLLENYAKYEIEKSGMKVYPNNIVFAMMFGTIFAIIGFLISTILFALVFGYAFAFVFSCYVFVILIIAKYT